MGALGPRPTCSAYETSRSQNNVRAIELARQGAKFGEHAVASLTGSGSVNGHSVKCISAEHIVKFHTGYESDENDIKDISALCERNRLSRSRVLS